MRRLVLTVASLVWVGAMAAAVTIYLQQGRLEDAVADTVMAGTFMAVGVAIAWTRRERMGWVFTGVGFFWALQVFTVIYAQWAYSRQELAPGALFFLWLAEWTWIPWLFLLLGAAPHLFPNGRLVSPRWRYVFVPLSASVTFLTVAAALDKVLNVDEGKTVPNPIGISPLGDPDFGVLAAVFFPTLLLSAVTGAASLVVRFRRSRGDERQQMKWFVYASLVFIGGFFTLVFIDSLGGSRPRLVDAVLTALPPLGAGVAMLRYRLYDIDVVINRTLVYGTLTALLAACYLGLVVALQALLATFAAESDLAIAGSTLAVAALFRPLRARVQSFIDRRFYRRRYDAARAIDRFSTHLRHEVDLSNVTRQIVSTLDETVQPSHASLWVPGGVT